MNKDLLQVSSYSNGHGTAQTPNIRVIMRLTQTFEELGFREGTGFREWTGVPRRNGGSAKDKAFWKS